MQQVYPYNQADLQQFNRVLYESPPAAGVGVGPSSRRELAQVSHVQHDPSLRYSLTSQSAERNSLSSSLERNRIIEHRPIETRQTLPVQGTQVHRSALHEPQLVHLSKPTIQTGHHRVVQQSSLLQHLKPKPAQSIYQPQTLAPAPVIQAKPVSSQIHSAQTLHQLSPQVQIQPLTHEAMSTVSKPIVIRSERSQSPNSQAQVTLTPLTHLQSSLATYHSNLATQPRYNTVYHEITQHQTPSRPMAQDADDGTKNTPPEGAKMSLEYSKDGSSSFKYSLSNNRDPSI